MAIIFTGPNGAVGYLGQTQQIKTPIVSVVWRKHPTELRYSFARLPAFAQNGNHAPSGLEGAIISDVMLDFLYGVAAAR